MSLLTSSPTYPISPKRTDLDINTFSALSGVRIVFWILSQLDILCISTAKNYCTKTNQSVTRYISREYGSSIWRSSGQGEGHRSQKRRNWITDPRAKMNFLRSRFRKLSSNRDKSTRQDQNYYTRRFAVGNNTDKLLKRLHDNWTLANVRETSIVDTAETW